jgi:hypothetical protein
MRTVRSHENSKICLDPGSIIGALIVGIDMTEKIEPAKDDTERILPAPIGVGLHIKSDGNKVLDVDVVVGTRIGGGSCGSGGGARNFRDECGRGGVGESSSRGALGSALGVGHCCTHSKGKESQKMEG